MSQNGSQHILSQVFGAQEYRREVYHQSTRSTIAKASQWIASKLGATKFQNQLLDHSTILNNLSSSENLHCEFGIALDYSSGVFQVIDSSSEKDIKLLKFSNLSESLTLSEKLMKKVQLPLDLNDTVPFSLHPPSIEPLADLDTPLPSLSWSDVSLAANVQIPSAIVVPSILELQTSLDDANSSFHHLWYQPHARALLRQYLRAPSTPIAITVPPPLPLRPKKTKSLKSNQGPSSSPQEVSYDPLSGRGGVWTDNGKWLEWNEICGSFDEVLFGDGKGVFGHEDDAVDGKKSKAFYNSFGQLISGKETKEEMKEQGWEQGF
jgi:hypothetical protein